MEIQSKYSAAELERLQKIKSEIQDLRKQLVEIDQEVGGLKQNFTALETEQPKIYSHYSPKNSHENNSHIESTEENKEKPWGNYIMVVLIVFYFVVMSFL